MILRPTDRGDSGETVQMQSSLWARRCCAVLSAAARCSPVLFQIFIPPVHFQGSKEPTLGEGMRWSSSCSHRFKIAVGAKRKFGTVIKQVRLAVNVPYYRQDVPGER
eukprot:GHVU01039001.1.p1 GENE.GHVU01039001.1~~GHVU01039001.1.p1  ORF type:complete len:107 (-),score=3.20 GHVU01039001.1:1532-1852(-)